MDTLLQGAAGVTSVLATGAVLYRCIRPRFPVKVNCHFCDNDTHVPYGNRNCWDCPSCDQYNGFALDGDYNKPIPAQFSEDLNHPISAEQRTPSEFSTTSVLCPQCAQNQLLKVKQLANFVPYEESNYDAEVEAYQNHLEHVYHLCRICEKKVDRSLRRQNDVLQHKLSESGSPGRLDASQGSVFLGGSFIELPSLWYVRLLRLSVFIVSCIILATNTSILAARLQLTTLPVDLLPLYITQVIDIVYRWSRGLVFTALFMNIAAIGVSGKESLTSLDAMSCILWLALVTLQSASSAQWLPLQDVRHNMAPLLSLVTTVTGLWCALCPRYRRAASPTRIRTRRLRPNSSFASSTSSQSHDLSPNKSERSWGRETDVESRNRQSHGIPHGLPSSQSERSWGRQAEMDSRHRRSNGMPHGLSASQSERSLGQEAEVDSRLWRSHGIPHGLSASQSERNWGREAEVESRHRQSHGLSHGLTTSQSDRSWGREAEIEPRRLLYDQLDNLETLSIGEPSRLTDRGPLSATSRAPSGVGSINHMRTSRPLLSPARLATGTKRARRGPLGPGGQQYIRQHSFGLPKGGPGGPRGSAGNQMSGVLNGFGLNNGFAPGPLFQPTAHSQRSNSFNTAHGSFMGNNTFDDRASMFSQLREDNSQDDSDSGSANSFITQSHASSHCPVDTTFTENEPQPQNKKAAPVKRSIFSSLVLGFSIGLNLCLVLYFLVERTMWENVVENIIQLPQRILQLVDKIIQLEVF